MLMQFFLLEVIVVDTSQELATGVAELPHGSCPTTSSLRPIKKATGMCSGACRQ